MSAGSVITATEYNNIYNLMAGIVGTGGYGRSLLSSTVTAGTNTITSLQQTDLYKDLQAAHVHQNNFVNTAILPSNIEVGDSITFDNIDNFETVVDAIVAFNPSISDFPAANFDEAGMVTTSSTTVSSSRSSAWGTGATYRIGHRVTVNWASASARNHYFNAGGQIRFDAGLTGGTSSTSETKDWDWARILNEMGKIRFVKKGNVYKTESLGTGGTGSEFSIGNFSTNTAVSGGFLNSPTRIYTKVGGGTSGGNPGTVPVTQIYDDNEYQINVVVPSSSQFTFEIIFDDSDSGTGGQSEGVNNPIDEQVTGTITSNLYTFTPNSSFLIGGATFDAIVQTPPTGTLDSSL